MAGEAAAVLLFALLLFAAWVYVSYWVYKDIPAYALSSNYFIDISL